MIGMYIVLVVFIFLWLKDRIYLSKCHDLMCDATDTIDHMERVMKAIMLSYKEREHFVCLAYMAQADDLHLDVSQSSSGLELRIKEKPSTTNVPSM